MTATPYPTPSSPAVSKRMRRNPSGDTQLELRVRSALHRSGLRFRKTHRLRAGDVSVRPDVVFTRARVAIFLDGCFWHGCPEHGTSPRVNSRYWSEKFVRNAARDQRVNEALAADGWTVLRFWEHEAADEIARAVERAVSAPGQ